MLFHQIICTQHPIYTIFKKDPKDKSPLRRVCSYIVGMCPFLVFWYRAAYLVPRGPSSQVDAYFPSFVAYTFSDFQIERSWIPLNSLLLFSAKGVTVSVTPTTYQWLSQKTTLLLALRYLSPLPRQIHSVRPTHAVTNRYPIDSPPLCLPQPLLPPSPHRSLSAPWPMIFIRTMLMSSM